MRVESAIYGEVANGHALRVASADVEFARSIAGRFDLPSNPPPGVVWSPAISGFPAHGRYVVGRTFLDTDAPRGNMVLAHALFTSLDDIQDFTSLARLLDRLAVRFDQIPEPVGFEIEDAPIVVTAPELREVAALLGVRGKRPIVKLGADGIETLAAALWAHLWPGMRRKFAFRLSFGPDDVVEAPAPVIVYSPQSLAVRWQAYPVIGQASSPASRAAEILSGDADAALVMGFATSIGRPDLDLSEFPLAVRAQDLIAQGTDFDALAGGMRLINLLAPADCGEPIKADLIRRLAAMMPTATAAQMMSLRNFSLAGFSTLQPVWEAAERWMETQDASASTEVVELTRIIAASHNPGEAIADWRMAITRGGRAMASVQPTRFAMAFWTWLLRQPQLIEALFDFVPHDPAAERSLLGAIPQRLDFDASALLHHLAIRSWLTLHGAVLAASRAPADAVRAQLDVDKSASFLDGLRAALSRARPAERVAIAIAGHEQRLDVIAGAEIAADFSLLRALDYRDVATQRLWVVAIDINAASWQGVEEPFIARNAILDRLLDNDRVFAPLIGAFSATPLADLSDYGRRAEVWDRIDPAEPFLAATAEGWLRRAGDGNPYPFDTRLEETVMQPGRLDSWLGRRIGIALNIIASLDRLPQERALVWFRDQAKAGSFTIHDAELLGRIILDRRWSTLLDRVRDRVWLQREFMPALRVCATMLLPITRWMLGLSPISVEEKWEGLAALASDLYPGGPEERDLWERSGGRNSALLRRTTGAEIWRAALRAVRRGDGPQITILLAEMLKDYKNNRDLRFMVNDTDITRPQKRGW